MGFLLLDIYQADRVQFAVYTHAMLGESRLRFRIACASATLVHFAKIIIYEIDSISKYIFWPRFTRLKYFVHNKSIHWLHTQSLVYKMLTKWLNRIKKKINRGKKVYNRYVEAIWFIVMKNSFWNVACAAISKRFYQFRLWLQILIQFRFFVQFFFHLFNKIKW